MASSRPRHTLAATLLAGGIVSCAPSGDGAKTTGVIGGSSLEGAYFVDGTGVDLPSGAGVDVSRVEAPCRKSEDCESDACFGATSTTSGRCLSVCAVAGPHHFRTVRSCIRGLERCLYLPSQGLGFCLPLCTSDRDCPPKFKCKPITSSRPDLGSLCDD